MGEDIAAGSLTSWYLLASVVIESVRVRIRLVYRSNGISREIASSPVRALGEGSLKWLRRRT